MTMPTTSSRVDYLGDGSSTTFAVPYRFFDAAELRVLERDVPTGAETVLTLGSQYTVSGGNGGTGTVTAAVAPASTKQWTILRNTRRTQDVDLQPNDPLPAETLERALDRQIAIVQEIERDAGRSLRIAETDPGGSLVIPTSVDRANRVLGFNSAGEPVASVPGAGGLVVSPLASALLADTTVAQMLARLKATFIGEYREVAFAAAEPGWLLCYGQAVSRATYADLFDKIGTTYGSGDGSTTFNLPDRRGRAAFGKDDMGGSAANRLTTAVSGVAGATLGASGGSQLVQQHAHSVSDPTHTHGVNDPGHSHSVLSRNTLSGMTAGAVAVWEGESSAGTSAAATGITLAGSGTGIAIQAYGTGNSQNIPPALVVNVMIYTGVY